ncbi:hypothetical protein RN001_009386 [Aquatica leii]|uniref:Uncharacterized protein n=1 Tax=Aquatica leii TaxID=1421715 RepID=A0AAN7NZJ7_9COLE|nr:hypothetical protein RN001_009386 [Aquatica leii]
MFQRGKYLVALAAKNEERIVISSFSEVVNRDTEVDKENLKDQQYDNNTTDGNIEVKKIRSEKQPDLLKMYPELHIPDDCLMENPVDDIDLDRQPTNNSGGDIMQLPIIFLETPTQIMEFDLCENDNESEKISNQNDHQILQYENIEQNVLHGIHYARSKEATIPVNNFVELRPVVPVRPTEYREESPMDVSDLDPTYEPSDNDEPKTKKRIFCANDPTLSDSTERDNIELDSNEEQGGSWMNETDENEINDDNDMPDVQRILIQV